MVWKCDLKIMEGDEAFYFLHEEGNLKGAVLTHVDDNIIGNDIIMVMILVDRELTISKIERTKFRFTDLDIASVEDGIEILMEDYVPTLKSC